MHAHTRTSRSLFAASIAAALLFTACDRPDDTPASAADPTAAPATTTQEPASEVALNPQMARMDSNEDGAVSFDEHALGAASRFTAMDRDGDGHLTQTELQAGANGASNAEVSLAAADEDRDGRLSHEEHERGARTSFDHMDADSDGRLTWRELENQAQVAVSQR